MKRNISKKMIALLSSLFLAVFVFVGCSSSKTETEKNTAETTEEAGEKTEENTTETSEDNKEEASNQSPEVQEAIAKQAEIDKIIEDAQSKKTSTDDSNKNREVFVDASYVKDLIDGKKNVENYVIAEVTWGEAKDSPDYLTKHIPGAIHINTDSIEEGPIWNLKAPEEIKNSLLDYGITKDTTLVVYGPDTGAHRLAFAALYEGVSSVKVLDGGLSAWEKAGFETEADEVKAEKASDFGIEVPANPEYVLTLNQVNEKLKNDPNFQLISNRSENEWLGKESGYSYIPRAGEIKGALWGKSGSDNSDMSFYQNEDKTNKSWEEITKMWEAEGISLDKDLSFYCGTGWRAALPWLMAYEKGYNPSMYDGGWNEWQMHDDLEVQVGDPKNSDSTSTTVKELPTDKATL